jgi:hypothetical protein
MDCDDTAESILTSAVQHLAKRSTCDVAFGGGRMFGSSHGVQPRATGIRSTAGGIVTTKPGSVAHAFMNGGSAAGKTPRESRKNRAKRVAKYDRISGHLAKQSATEVSATPWDGLDVPQSSVDATRAYVVECITARTPIDPAQMDALLVA